jgi:hypothetical protein
MTRTRERLTVLALMIVMSLATCADVGASDRTHTTPVVVKLERGGFRWSDAGVGVLGGIGLSLTVCGCLALARLRDADRSSGTRGEQS